MALSQKDIDNLEIKDKAYLKPVGEPKELYIKVHPTGRKVFQVREQKAKVYATIGEYRKNILNLAQARVKAFEILQKIANNEFVDKKENITLNEVNIHYLNIKSDILSTATIKKEQLKYNKYIKPSLGDKNINSLEKKHFLPIYDLMYKKGIYETLNRNISFLCRILELARQRGELKTNIINDLKDLASYYKNISGNIKVNHFKAMVEEKEIKHLLECMKDYKNRPRTNINIVNAIYFTLLTAQRSKNIRFAKWSEIDFENKLWIIKAQDMKVRSNGDNIIPLNKYALKILETQKILNSKSEYIFANDNNEIISESYGIKFFKNYELNHTIHGYRSTFKSVCVDKSDELVKQGISDKVVEMILHHSKGDEIEKAYNRAKAIDLRIKLMKWYGEYLNSLCEFDL